MKMTIDTLRLKVARKNGFIGSLLYSPSMNLIEDPDCPTAYTNGTTMGINMDWLSQFSPESQTFVVAHECLHNIFQHPRISKQYRDAGYELIAGEKYNPLKANIAMDYVINTMCIEMGFVMPLDKKTRKPIGVLNNTLVVAHETWQEVYKHMPIDEQRDRSFDEHRDPEEGEKGQSDGQTDKQLERDIRQAQVAGEIAGDDMPASMKRLLATMLDPIIDWREATERFMQAVSLGSDQQDWTRLSRQTVTLLCTMPHYVTLAPAANSERLGSVAVIADVSGSIDDKLLSGFVTEVVGIKGLCSPETIHVLPTCTRVRGHYIVDEHTSEEDIMDLDLAFSGGTDLEAAFPMCEELGVDAIIVLTDGHTFTSLAKQPSMPVLWVTTDNDSFAYGDVVKLDERLYETK